MAAVVNSFARGSDTMRRVYRHYHGNTAMHDALSAYLALFGPEPDWKQVLLISLTPVFIAALGLEYVVMRRRGRSGNFRLADIATNFTLGGSYQLLELVWFALFVGAAWQFGDSLRLFHIEMNWASWIALMLGQEFFYYWMHRANHRIRWFWCAHVVHHSSEYMNLSTAMRQSFTLSLNFSKLFWLPLLVIGFDAKSVMLAYAINLAYQYFVHTEAVGKLHPWLEFVFNTPSHHRAHHGRNARYIDKNFGGMLIIWDRLFGTFVEEDPHTEPVDYGIPRQIHSANLLTINLHEWLDMARDALRPGPLSMRLRHLWAPPEWRRDATQSPSNGKHATAEQ